MKLTRPQPIVFERADGSTITAPPVTRGQIRRAYELEAEAADDPQRVSERRAKQLEILLEKATCTGAAGQPQQLCAALDSLTIEEEIDILTGLVCQHHGHNPETAVEAMRTVRELHRNAAKKKARAKS